jgi:hypothetical protein
MPKTARGPRQTPHTRDSKRGRSRWREGEFSRLCQLAVVLCHSPLLSALDTPPSPPAPPHAFAFGGVVRRRARKRLGTQSGRAGSAQTKIAASIWVGHSQARRGLIGTAAAVAAAMACRKSCGCGRCATGGVGERCCGGRGSGQEGRGKRQLR